MPVVADFTVIDKPTADGLQDGTFDKPYVIGDNLDRRFEVFFATGGRDHSPGLLTMMVRNLTRGSARVAFDLGNGNEIQIGRLQPSSEADRDLWRQQQFIIRTNILKASGQNKLIIGRVNDNLPGGGQFDDFEVRDIVCFFHQSTN